jgi:hypothetical protein
MTEKMATLHARDISRASKVYLLHYNNDLLLSHYLFV